MIMSTLIATNDGCTDTPWRKAGERFLGRLVALRTEQARRRIADDLRRRSDDDLAALGLSPDQIRCLREHGRLPHWQS